MAIALYFHKPLEEHNFDVLVPFLQINKVGWKRSEEDVTALPLSVALSFRLVTPFPLDRRTLGLVSFLHISKMC